MSLGTITKVQKGGGSRFVTQKEFSNFFNRFQAVEKSLSELIGAHNTVAEIIGTTQKPSVSRQKGAQKENRLQVEDVLGSGKSLTISEIANAISKGEKNAYYSVNELMRKGRVKTDEGKRKCLVTGRVKKTYSLV